MKTKLLLFMLLSLFAVQGWASPVCDSETDERRWDHIEGIRKNQRGIADLINEASKLKVKVDPIVVVFDGTVNMKSTQTIKITSSRPLRFINDADLTLEIKDTDDSDENGMFSIDRTVISPSETHSDEGALVTVTYNPTSIGTHKAVLHIDQYGEMRQLVHLNGTALERHITATGAASFNVDLGDSDSKYIHVKGTNLNGPLTVELNDKTGMYTIDKESITADEAARGIDVMVTYNPTSVGTHGADVTISGGGALETIVLIMSGHCEFPTPTIKVDETDLDFGTVILGQESHRDIEVSCSNLNGYLMLETHDPCYTVIPDKISPQEAAKGKKVNVTYKPTAAGTHDDFMGISCGLSGGPIVNLSGKCVTNPTISVTPSTWDFGTVTVGEESTPKRFTVTGSNLIEGISIISQLETPGVEFTVLPESESLPANGGTVTITYKPLYEGSTSQDFILSSSGVSSTITVSGTCVIPPTIKPDVTSLDFGTVVKGKTAPKKFTVRGINLTGDLTLSVSKPWFTVSPATITAADAAAGKEVTVIYKPTAGGNHNATLTISGGGAPDKIISLTGKCSAIDIAPSSSHDFGTVKEGSTNTAIFTVTGANISERISLVWLQEDGFSITPADLPASGGKVTVTFKPTSGGNYSQQYNLSSGNTSAKITVTGKCAAITPSRSSLNFGTLAKGKEKTDTFKVKGTYLTGDLTLSSSSSMFKVSPDKITASEAAAGKTVTVTYKPTAKGSHSATITISGGSAKTKLVQLTGKCVVPVITTSTNSINYMGKESKQFKVTGTDLTGTLTLTIIGSGKNYFNLSKTSITASAAASGVNVSVLCNAPSTLSSASAQVKISGGDAVTKYVDLYYNQNQPLAINSILPSNEDENGNDNGYNEFSNGGMLEMTGPLTTDVNELSMSSKVYAEGLDIIIETPIEQKALISDIAGHIREVNLKAGRNEIPVNANGVFIVRIREKTTKLMLK